MVSIPAVKYCLLCVMGHQSCLVEWTLCVMGFMCSVMVQSLEVYCATGLAIFLGTYYHLVAPCYWLVLPSYFDFSWRCSSHTHRLVRGPPRGALDPPLLMSSWFCACHREEQTCFSQVTYGKGLLINMQKLVLGPYLPDFTS